MHTLACMYTHALTHTCTHTVVENVNFCHYDICYIFRSFNDMYVRSLLTAGIHYSPGDVIICSRKIFPFYTYYNGFLVGIPITVLVYHLERGDR